MSYTTVELDAMSGGNIIAVDQIGGIDFQRVKVAWGAEGVAGDVTAANPLPVDIVDFSGLTVNVDSEFPAAAAASDNFANPTTTSVLGMNMLWDGATWDRAPGNTLGAFIQGNIASEDADSGNPVKVGGKYNSTLPAFSDGDRGDLQLESRGALRVAIYSGTSAAGVLGTQADNVSNGNGGFITTSFGYVFDGSAWDRAPGNSTDGALVDLGSNNDVSLNAGTNAIGKLAANSGVDIGDTDVTSVVPGTGASNLGKAEDSAHSSLDVGVMALATANEANTARAADNDYVPIATDTEGNIRIVGNRDHDAVDAGEVVSIGGVAIAHGTNPTAVAAADRTKLYFNRAGIPFFIGGHPNIIGKHINVTDADGAQTDTALVTVSAGTKIVVVGYNITADNANTGDVGFRLGFGTANTPANDAATDMIAAHPGLDGGSGMVQGNGGGILGVGADGSDLRLTCEDPVAGSFDVVVQYYTIES